jgi:hypothetical protein
MAVKRVASPYILAALSHAQSSTFLFLYFTLILLSVSLPKPNKRPNEGAKYKKHTCIDRGQQGRLREMCDVSSTLSCAVGLAGDSNAEAKHPHAFVLCNLVAGHRNLQSKCHGTLLYVFKNYASQSVTCKMHVAKHTKCN